VQPLQSRESQWLSATRNALLLLLLATCSCPAILTLELADPLSLFMSFVAVETLQQAPRTQLTQHWQLQPCTV
jgi:hypothetical protein